jgi:predicted  nucleic acid-binding Zn-ribbon protein
MGAENERMQQELRAARARLRGASGQMESVRDDQALQVQALRQSLRALNDHLLVVTTERDDAQRAHAAVLLQVAPAAANAAPSADGARLAAELAELRVSDAGLKAEVVRLAARLADADERIAGARTKADARISDVQGRCR